MGDGGILGLGSKRLRGSVESVAKQAGWTWGAWAESPAAALKLAQEKEIALVLVDGRGAEKQFWASWALEQGFSVIYCGWSGWDSAAGRTQWQDWQGRPLYQLEAFQVAAARVLVNEALENSGKAVFVETRIQVIENHIEPAEGIETCKGITWLLAVLDWLGDIDSLRAVSRSLIRNRAGADFLLVQCRLLNGIECTATIHALGKKEVSRIDVFGLKGQAGCTLPFAADFEQRVVSALRFMRENQIQKTGLMPGGLDQVQQRIQRALAWAAGLRQATRMAEEVGGHELKRIG